MASLNNCDVSLKFRFRTAHATIHSTGCSGHLTLGNQYRQLDILKLDHTTLLSKYHIEVFCMKIISHPQRSLQYVEHQLATQASCLPASPSEQSHG